jgi:hypothetical protein
MSHGRVTSTADIIKSLIFQPLQQDPTLLHSYPEELNVTKFQSDHTEAEWISLLLQLFSRLSECLIIVEAEDIFQADRDVPDWTKHFLELFQILVDEAKSSGNQVKILVLGYGSILLTMQSVPGQKNGIVPSIRRLHAVPPHLRRQFASRGNNIHLTGRQKLKSRF